MAKAISRNQQIRYFLYHSISSTKPSFHSLSNALSRTKPLPLSPLVGLRNLGLQAMRSGRLGSGLNCYRFLCTSNSVNQSSSGSSGSSSGANSGKSESSGGSQKTSEQGKSIRGSPVSWMSFFLLVCTGAGLVYYYDREKKRHIEDITTASTSVKQGPSAGKAAIGGPFSLIDHNGKPVTEKDFFEEKSGIQVIPVFISVDPERDTVEQVHEYVKEFHPNLIGLTGTPEEIKKTARAYRVYYMKTEEEGSDYLVDHSIVMYLMDPKMEFVKFFGKNNDVDMLTDGIINEIKQYNRVKA
ncbi:protein SCO1 homolog 1, mitochondrial isoform X2 [Nicotiana tabacum]|uniref:Protein SCO1 homolog 1, mitochondrial isoform X2 n=1 Tax=Nicotiana tabacum TaxID=4097 RepID=A0AC58S1P7_TOBAC